MFNVFEGLQICKHCHWRFVDFHCFRTRGRFCTTLMVGDYRVCQTCFERYENAQLAQYWREYENETRVEWEPMQ
jgi:hypothetical protein